MGKTRVRINSWEASHEEKWRHVPKYLKDKIEENQKTVKEGLQRQMIMDGGEGKKFKNCCVFENIEPQKQLRECNEIKEKKNNCSPMSKNSLKQGSDEWGNCSNVYKNIVKQSIEGSLGYCANGPMGVNSPMSKTRSKQGQDFSNVSNKIEKQGIAGRLVYCANGPIGFNSPMSKTISNIDSGGEMSGLLQCV